MPEATPEVVELINFLQESRESTIFSLKAKLSECVQFVLFLLKNQAIFHPDDISLNTRAFNWPRDMEGIMDLAATRLQMRKDFVEGVLKNRRLAFEETIHALHAKIDLFKKKDPPILSLDEMTAATQEIELIAAGPTPTSRLTEFSFHVNIVAGNLSIAFFVHQR